MPSKKLCSECGFGSPRNGCRLYSSNCANTPGKPSFMKPENLSSSDVKLAVVDTRKHVIAKKFRSKVDLATLLKEEGIESFGNEDNTLKSGQRYGNIQRGDEGSLN